MTFKANAPPQRRMCPSVLISFQLSAQNHHLACPSLSSEEFSTEGWPKCGSVGARWLIKASSNTQNCVLFFSKEVRPTIGYLNTSRSHRFGPEKSCRDLGIQQRNLLRRCLPFGAQHVCGPGELWNPRSLRTWAHFRWSRDVRKLSN